MDTPAERGRALERRVAAYFAQHGYQTTLNVVREGRSGATHEIDVLAVKQDSLTTYRVVVECKAWSSPISKDVVAKLDYVKHDLGLDKGIVVSLAGCQTGAQRAAAELGIELWGQEEIAHRLGAAAVAGVPPAAAGKKGLGLSPVITPEEAERSLRRAAQGHLGGREQLTWWSLVWIPAFELQLAVTRSEGRLRPRSVVTRTWNFYEGLTGALVDGSPVPPPIKELDLAPGSIPPLVRESRVAGAIAKAVDRLRSVSTESAIARHTEALRNLGVPLPLNSVGVEAARLVHLPFYLGLLQNRDHERFVTVSGFDGRRAFPSVSSALNQNIAHVRTSLQPVVASTATSAPEPTLEAFAAPTRPDPTMARRLAAEPSLCPCGGTFVLRHRHSGGQTFWGCDRFPRCRETRSVRPSDAEPSSQ